MLKGFVTAVSSAALLVASASPAFADPTQLHPAYSPAFDAPRGATAMATFRMPLGKAPAQTSAPTFGLTAGYGVAHAAPGLEGREQVRMLKFSDVRFSVNGLERAEVMTFDLANLDTDPRLNLFGGGEGAGVATWVIVLGVAAGGALICWAAGCFDDDDSGDIDSTSD